jgi:hypothetical protein
LGNSLQQLRKGLPFSATSISIDSDNMQMAFAIHAIGACRRSSSHSNLRAHCFFKPQRRAFMALKPGPKPTAKSTGKPLFVTREQARLFRNYRWKKMKEKLF